MIFMKPSAKLRSFLVPLFVVIAGNAYAASFDWADSNPKCNTRGFSE